MAARFEWLTAPEGKETILGRFAPPVRAWWEGRFTELTAPQALAIPAIQARRHTLVCAPTGSGKTLCAFIALLSDLFERYLAGRLGDGIDTVYISPLKALGSDVTRNLERPLEEIAVSLGIAAGDGPIRIAQRTGDTPSSMRARLGKHPPHLLVTTPESLALCLAQGPMRRALQTVRTIVIDELHSLASNKRGVDLAVSVERLSDLAARHNGGEEPARIGLSATIAPLERMAEYLVGAAAGGRSCAIADASFDRPLELEVRAPFGKTPFVPGHAVSKRVYDMLEEMIRSHRTTLVFTNTRAATERITFALRKRFAAAGEEALAQQIEAHHSSLDRELRLSIEQRLKAGTLRCVVCSTSLELGIDIGAIDRVVLLNPPKGIARGLQRVGRSGHSHGATARGTFIPTTPADLIETLVTAQMMRRRQLEEIRTPKNCLDVLAQQLIGMAVGVERERAEPGWTRPADGAESTLEGMYGLLRRTHSYADLPRDAFDRVVEYLATRQSLTPPPGAKLLLEGEGAAARVRPLRRSLATLYYQNVGTITSEGNVAVRLVGGESLGTLQEGFASLLKPRDRFILSGRCVEYVRSEKMTVFVVPSEHQQPTAPRWVGQMLTMADGLTLQMRDFRNRVRAIAPAGPGAMGRLLMRQYGASAELAAPAAAFLHAQHRYAGIPGPDELLVERVPDEDAVALVFHTIIGRAANEALARLVAYRMHRNFGGNSTVVVDDYAFGVWVANTSAARRADRTLIRAMLTPQHFEEELALAVAASDLFKIQFRFTALRAHAIVQNRFAHRGFIGQLQGYATRLHDALVEQSPEHVLLQETRRTIMEDLLNAPRAKAYLEEQSRLALRLADLSSPSPFAFGLFATSRRDTLQLADTNDFLLAMYEQVQRRLAAEDAARPAENALLF